MRNAVITLLGIAIGMSFSFAQSVGSIRGNVLDQTTEELLVGAKIVVVDSTRKHGVISDSTGAFALANLAPGRYVLRVSLLGYEIREFENIEVITGKETVVDLMLVPSVSELSTVVVKAHSGRNGTLNSMASVSHRTVSLEEKKRIAGTAGDPARLVAGFAGVNAVDGDNDLVIRGNSPVGMIWQMEGIEIPNPNHFSSQGASGGRISMLNSNMLSNSTFYTAAFPAEYGNGFSGVFDIHLREGNDQKREHAFKAGVLGMDLSTEGPLFKKLKGSYLVNYRYSTLAILDKIGVKVAGDVVPDYQDLTYHVKLRGTRFGKVNLFGLLGTGVAKNSWGTVETSFSDTYQSELMVSGIKYRKTFGSNTFLQFVGAYTATRRTYSRFMTNQLDSVPIQTYRERFLDPVIRGRICVSHKFNSQHHIRFGVIGNYLSFDHLSMQINDVQIMETDQDGKGDAFRYQGHFQWKYRVSPKFDFTAGVHYTHFSLTKEHRFEPRLGGRIEIDEQNTVSFGYGQHSKTWDLGIYNVQITDGASTTLPNRELEMLKAHHFVVGYRRAIGMRWKFSVETYFQHLLNVPVGSDSNSVTSLINLKNYYPKEALVNEGSGYNMGIELTMERTFQNHWYFNFTASVFDSKYQTQNGKFYNSRWNNNYIFNVLGGKEFILHNPMHVLNINLRFVWSGGNRYTPIDLLQSINEGTQVYDFESAYSKQFPDYVRLDLKVGYKLNRKRTTHEFMLDVQNVTNRTNYAGQYFDSNSSEVKRTRHLGIVPVLSYKILF